jgi:soluble lytic murein transglycosylase-like protein
MLGCVMGIKQWIVILGVSLVLGTTCMGSAVADAQDIQAEQATIQAYIQKYYPEVSETDAKTISTELVTQGKVHEMDPKLIAAIIAFESRFNPKAKNRSGAKGLGQLMSGTYRLFGVEDPFDIKQNISATMQYVKRLSAMWEGHPSKMKITLAAYIRGDQAIKRSQGKWNARTESYIQRILHRYETLTKSPSTPSLAGSDVNSH